MTEDKVEKNNPKGVVGSGKIRKKIPNLVRLEIGTRFGLVSGIEPSGPNFY